MKQISLLVYQMIFHFIIVIHKLLPRCKLQSLCSLQTSILMSLLYHNDTIIKKEKELLRALLGQFCKLEFVITFHTYWHFLQLLYRLFLIVPWKFLVTQVQHALFYIHNHLLFVLLYVHRQ